MQSKRRPLDRLFYADQLVRSCRYFSAAARPMASISRVSRDGRQIGVMGLSAHDLRHCWATDASRNGTKLEDLKVAGGWNSLVMPDRYIEEAKIANEGVKLGRD